MKKMKISLDDAVASRAWPFEEAKKLLDCVNGKAPAKGYVLFETGYGPSGLPHIGTFGEVVRTSMVRHAFSCISDIPTKLICFSDDMDGLRKVPSNVPNPDMLIQHIGKPLTSIPDPFGEKESYGHYMNNKLRNFLDRFGFQYDFFSATEVYKSGAFDIMLLKVMDKYQEIMDLMLPTFRDERRATYSPFMPVCKKTGKVLQVPILEVNKDKGTITYRDEDGELIEDIVTGGKCKLQWKPDFGMRWAALEIDYEMYGKDHMPNAELYSEICRILGGTSPLQYFYEMFLNDEGAKISKSKGNSITVDEWLEYAPVESLKLFMYNSPSKAKRLHFDVIPKSVDEYITFNKKFFEANNDGDVIKQISNPVYHINMGNVAEVNLYGITFGMLLNLASVCNPDNKSVLWGFISRYNAEATPSSSIFLDQLVECAINYYNNFIKPNKIFIVPSENYVLMLKQIRDYLESIDDATAGDIIQNEIYKIGTDNGCENLREYFKTLYTILLGQEEGPRLGSFIKLFGIGNTIKLITEKVSI